MDAVLGELPTVQWSSVNCLGGGTRKDEVVMGCTICCRMVFDSPSKDHRAGLEASFESDIDCPCLVKGKNGCCRVVACCLVPMPQDDYGEEQRLGRDDKLAVHAVLMSIVVVGVS